LRVCCSTVAGREGRFVSRRQDGKQAAIIGPRLAKHLEGNVIGQPEMQLFPVIAS